MARLYSSKKQSNRAAIVGDSKGHSGTCSFAARYVQAGVFFAQRPNAMSKLGQKIFLSGEMLRG